MPRAPWTPLKTGLVMALMGLGGLLPAAGTTVIEFQNSGPERLRLHLDYNLRFGQALDFLEIRRPDGASSGLVDARHGQSGIAVGDGETITFAFDFSGLGNSVLDATCVFRFTASTESGSETRRYAYTATRYYSQSAKDMIYDAALEQLPGAEVESKAAPKLPAFAVEKLTPLPVLQNDPVVFQDSAAGKAAPASRTAAPAKPMDPLLALALLTGTEPLRRNPLAQTQARPAGGKALGAGAGAGAKAAPGAPRKPKGQAAAEPSPVHQRQESKRAPRPAAGKPRTFAPRLAGIEERLEFNLDD